MSQVESAAGVSLVLLPGMDGTGQMFNSFTAALPATIRSVVVTYPPDRPLGYPELEAIAEQAFPAEGWFVVLGESFSGPLAMRIAARGHPRLAGIVLIASFVHNPLPRLGPILRPFVGSWSFGFPPPCWTIRRYLAGADAPDDLIAEFQGAVRTVSPAVMAKRAREVLAVDVRGLLPRIRVPVLLLVAGHDRLVSTKMKDDFRELGDFFKYVCVDAPHLILQRKPESAAEIIEGFLQRIRTGNPANESR
ncbi:MAG: alpha/beta fold hydrolase [Planctomycetia bacterium]|nr:alpha/beta fold hydrolase [Planctomycetia bacterium]